MTETNTPDAQARLTMPLGEAMFTQRSIRRMKPDPIPVEDLRTVIEAASKAPSGSNTQPGRFLVLTDREVIRQFGALYHEAWWAKRRDEGRPWTTREAIPDAEAVKRGAARLADEMADAPCIVLALSAGKGGANSVLPAVQNLMLAARALGIGSVPTTLAPNRDRAGLRSARDSGGGGVPLLHSARLPTWQLRPDPAPPDGGDNVLQSVGCTCTLG